MTYAVPLRTRFVGISHSLPSLRADRISHGAIMNRRHLFTLLITIPFIPIAIAATPPPTVKAPQADAPTHVLFVGNS